MKGAQLNGLVALVFGSALFVFLGAVFVIHAPAIAGDFRASYYSARCLTDRGCDPFAEPDVFRMYAQQEPELPVSRFVVTRYVYLPTAFLFTLPFAILPVGPAHVLWMVLTGAGIILAAFLMWNFGRNDAPLASSILVAFLLANSGMALAIGNPAGLTVAFSIIAVWCFVNERFVPAGILCLAIGLALKPHDAGFVWLFLLLAGGSFTKNALRVLALFVIGALPVVLWTMHISPNWISEIRSNLQWFTQRGGINDPGPSSFTGHGVIRAIDLQAVVSVFKDDPHFYNAVSFLVCGLLILAWAIAILRLRPNSLGLWFVFAGVAALSMLPSYHRPYDAKLILLVIPAFAILWSERGAIRWIALLFSGAAIAATGDFPLALLIHFAREVHVPQGSLAGKLITILLWNPTPLILLATSIFFLWAYMRHSSHHAALSSFAGSARTSNSRVTA